MWRWRPDPGALIVTQTGCRYSDRGYGGCRRSRYIAAGRDCRLGSAALGVADRGAETDVADTGVQDTKRSVTVEAENDDVDVVFVPVDVGWEWVADDSGSGVPGIWSEPTVVIVARPAWNWQIQGWGYTPGVDPVILLVISLYGQSRALWGLTDTIGEEAAATQIVRLDILLRTNDGERHSSTRLRAWVAACSSSSSIGAV